MVGYIREEGSKKVFIDEVEEFITKAIQQYNYISEGGLYIRVWNTIVQRLKAMTMWSSTCIKLGYSLITGIGQIMEK